MILVRCDKFLKFTFRVPVGTQAFSSAAKRRRQSSPGPIIVIKDEPEEMDRMRYVRMK